MGPQALAQVLRPLAGLFDAGDFPQLLRGLDVPDDAAVWRLDDERALILTSDFFPPVVDDPVSYGRIAAANALSDVYAMGGTPLFAINLAAFPDDLDPTIVADVLRGGAEKVREAGAAIAGGHTTVDREPKYGLAVVGLVRPDAMLANGGARPGDALWLTKPLGTGLITTAARNDAADPDDLRAAVASMERLSAGALAALRASGAEVHAATDVTGFGLAGHGHEMAAASGCALELRSEALPLLPGVAGYLAAGQSPGGARRNREHYGPRLASDLPEGAVERAILFDPQTSGGLLFASDPAGGAVAAVERAFAAAGEPLHRVGRAVEGPAGSLRLV